jgi:two-component system response regulator RegA
MAAQREATDDERATRAPSLLIVDDDEVFRTRLARAFRERGYDVRRAATRRALARAPRGLARDGRRRPPHAGPSGSSSSADMKASQTPATRIVPVLTGYGSIRHRQSRPSALARRTILPKARDVERQSSPPSRAGRGPAARNRHRCRTSRASVPRPRRVGSTSAACFSELAAGQHLRTRRGPPRAPPPVSLQPEAAEVSARAASLLAAIALGRSSDDTYSAVEAN